MFILMFLGPPLIFMLGVAILEVARPALGCNHHRGKDVGHGLHLDVSVG
jgi:hypothetical protein